MARILILGSASAVPDQTHENTHILVEGDQSVVLVDCPGSPLVRLEEAGVAVQRLTDVILTHFHPDHVSGFAPLLMGMWLTGRTRPLNVFGLEPTIRRAEQMMELYDWHKWPNFYPVNFVSLPAVERVVVFQAVDLNVYASPVEHMIPTIGLRFEFLPQQRTAVYSCDTQPSPVVTRLAEGCDVLIHESTGPSLGHTPPEAAGQVAAAANAKALCLIHYPPQLVTPDALLDKAQTTFNGPVMVAKDFLSIAMD